MQALNDYESKITRLNLEIKEMKEIDLKQKCCELTNENNALKVKIQVLKNPSKKEESRLTAELDFEKEKNR